MLRFCVHARGAHFRRGAAAEQPLEDDLRVQLHRQRAGSQLGLAGRRRQVDPRDRVRVRAAVAFAAVARARVRILHGELQRRQQRLLADLRGDHLIDRRTADGRVGPGGLARLDPGQVGRRDPVIRSGGALGRLGGFRPQSAHDDRLLSHLLERLQNVGQLRRQRPFGVRLPVPGRHAVRKEDAHETRLARPPRSARAPSSPASSRRAAAAPACTPRSSGTSGGECVVSR